MNTAVDTLPKMFLKAVQEAGEKPALRRKDRGIYKEISWNQYHDNVKSVFYALVKMDFKEHDIVAIISENRPEWLYTDLAAQSAMGMSVGIFPNCSAKEIEYYLNHSKAKFVLCEDQEQTDKVLQIKGNLKYMQKVIVIDWRGMWDYNDSLLMSFEELVEIGQEHEKANPGLMEKSIAKGDPNLPAMMAYTSGTTGDPKGALISNRNMSFVADATMKATPMTQKDEVLSYLPLGWMGERMYSLFFPLRSKSIVNFPETMEPEVVFQNRTEVFPSVLYCPPSVWEGMLSYVHIKHQNSTWFKRQVFRLFMAIGEKYAQLKMGGGEIPGYLKVLYLVGEVVLYRWIRRHLGLLDAKICITGGSAIGADVFRFYHGIGVPLRQGYGQTESTGGFVYHEVNDIRPESVGKPLDGIEVAISENDEVMVKGPCVFVGYFENKAATERTVRDGWLYTGDQGYFDDHGHLVIIDRRTDVYKTSGGFQFSPQLIENKLRFSPYIKEAVIIGNNEEKVTSLIQIDYVVTGNWAQRKKISYTTFKDLSLKPEVHSLIAKEIAKTNATLAEPIRVQEFILLEKELDADDGELTRSNKIKRDFIVHKYKHIVEEMYQK